MKPLQAVAMGQVIVLVTARPFHSHWDLLADPLGWLLVLLGVQLLPAELAYRSSLITLSALALLASIPTWLPMVAAPIEDADPSLSWALTLPALGFVFVLGLGLSDRARAEKASSDFRTWRTVATLAVVCAALPVLVFGGGVTRLATLSAGLSGLLLPAAVIVLGFAHSGRPWLVDAETQNGPDPHRGQGRSQT